jgi:hypothetical protein
MSTTEIAPALLPCPWCCGPANFDEILTEDSGPEYIITCSHDAARCPVIGAYVGPYPSLREAAKKWNTRYTLADIPAIERFNIALKALTTQPGWEVFYSIRAESMGLAKGYWYYHSEGRFSERIVLQPATHGRKYPAVLGVGKAVDEEALYEDIDAGLVQLARVPNERHECYYPFKYLFS